MRDTVDMTKTGYIALLAVLAAVYFAAGRLGQVMAIPPGNVSPVWPPSGIALAAVLLFGRRVWPGIMAGASAVNLTFLDWSGADAFALSLAAGLAIGVGSFLQPLAGAALLNRYMGKTDPTHTVGDILKFAAIAPVMCLVSASIGSTSLCLGGLAPWAGWAEVWLTWWLGDTVGVFIATPLILAWSRPGTGRLWRGETALIFASLGAASLLAFNNPQAYPLAFLPVPFLLWAALRLDMRGATTAILLVSAISIVCTHFGTGPFRLESTNLSLLVLQLFIFVITLTVHIIAAFVEERANANAVLEQRVEERTRALEAEGAERAERSKRQTALAQVRDAVWNLKGTDELDALVESVLQSLRTAEIPFRNFGINIVDNRVDPPTIFIWGVKDGAWHLEQEDAEGREILLGIWRAQKLAYRRDLLADDHDGEAERITAIQGNPVRCILDVPFSHGTLAVNSTEANAFSDGHVATLEEIAGVLSEGFRRLDDLRQLEERNKALEEEVAERERRSHRQSALQRIRDAIWKMEDSQDVADLFTAVGKGLEDLELPFRNYGINILNDLENPTEILINDRRARRLPIGDEAPWTRNIVSFWRARDIVYRRDLDADNPYDEGFTPQTGERTPIRCILDVPFSHGTLALNSERANAFDDWHIDVLEEMAAILSEGFRRLDDLRALEESQNFLRGVIDNSTAAIYSKAYDGKYLLVNRRFSELLHISEEGAIGRDDYDFWPDDPEIADAIRKNDLRVLESGAPIEEEEIVPIDGEDRIFISLKFPLFDETNKVFAMCGMSTDITEIKEAELQARQAQQTAEAANRSKSAFLANMSHEIRTPMNAILGFSEILAGQLTQPQHQHYLDSIQTSGKSLMTLINDILDLSKVEAGKLELEYRPAETHALFTDMETIFAQKVAEKDLAFPIELAADLPPGLVLDEARVRQVLINLIGNAIKFTKEGEVRLTAEARPREGAADRVDLVFAITDTGIGIPADEQDKIFGAFEQREGQSINEYGGTGLGLAISRQLVGMMNGRIELESEVDRGSTFRVTLEGVELAEITPTTALTPDAVAFAPSKVLIADDVAVNRELVKGFLSGYAFEFSEAENGQEAIERCHSQRPDLVLMDIKMPVLDGHEATKRIKVDPNLRHIPVVALTASAMRETEEELSRVCDGFLKKPVGQAELVHELTRFLAYDTVESDETVAPETADAPFVPDAAVLARLPELAEKLSAEQAHCDQLLANLTINDIEDFAARMQEQAGEYGYTPLGAWADQLADQTGLFDLEGMQRSLSSFANVVEEIQATLAANAT